MPMASRGTNMNQTEKRRAQLIRELIKLTDEEVFDEEFIHLLIGQKLSLNLSDDKNMTYGQKAADKVAQFAGSWAFIFTFVGCIVLWIIINLLMMTNAFDQYPFILLNLILSCIAAIQAPLIMMSQNRQEAKDRERAENDFRVNLKSEAIIGDLYTKMEMVLKTQHRIIAELEQLKKHDQKEDSDLPS